MIVFRQKSYSSFMEESTIQKLTNNFNRERIDSYDISSSIPQDAVSINADLDNVEIYFPEENEYFQYDVDSFLRKSLPSVRQQIDQEDDFTIMRFFGKLRFDQYYKLVKFIIEENGYCVIVKR